VSAGRSGSTSDSFYSACCIVLYTDHCTRFNCCTTSMRYSVSYTGWSKKCGYYVRRLTSAYDIKIVSWFVTVDYCDISNVTAPCLLIPYSSDLQLFLNLRYTWTLHQDSAPSHTTRNTMQYLWRQDRVIQPDMLPHTVLRPSLIQSITVFGSAAAAEQLVYCRRRLTSIGELRKVILELWRYQSQVFIDKGSGDAVSRTWCWECRTTCF